MTTRRFAAILSVVLVSALLSGCVALDSSPDDGNESEVDPEAVFEGAFVHADDLQDVQGNRTVNVTNGTVTMTERVRIQKRPYVDDRSVTLDSSDPATIGDVYVSNATRNWFYYPDAQLAQYFEPEEPFDNDAVRADRADMAERRLEQYDIEYRGTETVAGRETHVIDVEAKNETVEKGVSAIVGDTEYVYALETSSPKEELETVEQTLWIDAEYEYPLRSKVVFDVPDGERIVLTQRFESVAFNTGLEDETFAFEPPENATVEDIS